MSIVGSIIVPHPPLMIPEVGRGEEKSIAQTTAAYEEAASFAASLQPETLIISSPHSIMYRDYFHISKGTSARGNLSAFGAPDVRFYEEYDTELVQEICRLADQENFPAGILGERDPLLDHGTMVPLYFLHRQWSSFGDQSSDCGRTSCTDTTANIKGANRRPPFRIIRIGLSGLSLEDHYHFGMLIQKAVENLGRRVVYVASGDLSHKLKSYGPYGYAKEGPAYDEQVMKVCGGGCFGGLFDFAPAFLEKAAECGHRSFVIMAGALDGRSVEAKVLSHQDVTGVGYGVCTFSVRGEDGSRHFLERRLQAEHARTESARKEEDAWTSIARFTIENFVQRGVIPAVSGDAAICGAAKHPLPDALLSNSAGVFVSIHEHGELRGCIGTILPTRENIAEEIIQNAVSACSEDPRFSPVTRRELPYLALSVDVLGKPENIDGPEELDVHRYGVIVSKGSRRGLLLPDLDGVDSVDQQIRIAKQKAGINPSEKDVTLQRFEVIRHH